MKKGFILATIVAAMSIIGYVESAQSKTDTSMIQLTDMEAISTCELPDGYSPMDTVYQTTGFSTFAQTKMVLEIAFNESN